MTQSASCPETEALAGILLSGAGDERRAHVESCPRCRAQLAELRAFLEPGDVPGARVEEADVVLAAALSREMRLTPSSAVRPIVEAARPSFWASLFAPAMRPAWSAAVVLVVAGGVWMATQPPDATLRGGGENVIATRVPAISNGELTLTWEPVPGADGYDVTFFAPDLSELASPEHVTEPRLVLRPGALPAGLSSGANVMWQVSARQGPRELTHSVTTRVVLP